MLRSVMNKYILLAACAFMIGVQPSSATAAYCSEPSEPYCVDGFGTYDSDFSFQSCRGDMDQFASETEDYIDCLRRAQQEAIDAYNESVERFNCHAGGSTFCY